MPQTMVRVEGTLILNRENSVLVSQGSETFWIPKSQIKYSRKTPPASYECHIPLWLANKKDGLEYEELD